MRQERDARLKNQALASTKAKSETFPRREVELEDEEALLDAANHSMDSDTDEDIALLPDELLQADIEQLPEVPAAHSESKQFKLAKPKITFKESVPIDRQVGPVNVRVLENFNQFLAPKGNLGAKGRREAWLKGRKHGNGVGGFERKPMNAGFVRR